MGWQAFDTPDTPIFVGAPIKLLFLCLSLCCALVCWFDDPQVAPLETRRFGSGARIFLPEGAVYDFGRRRRRDSVLVKIPFANRGRRSLRLNQVQTSCDCLEFDLPIKRSYMAGERGLIIVRVDTRGLRGPLEKALYLLTNDRSQPRLEVIIRGVIEVPPAPEVQLIPAMQPVLYVTDSLPPKVSFSLLNRGQRPLRFQLHSDHFDLAQYKALLNPGAQMVISGQLKHALANAGFSEKTIQIRSNDPENPELQYVFQFYRPNRRPFLGGLSRSLWNLGTESSSAQLQLQCFNDSPDPMRLEQVLLPPEVTVSQLPLTVPAKTTVPLTLTWKASAKAAPFYQQNCQFRLIQGNSEDSNSNTQVCELKIVGFRSSPKSPLQRTLQITDDLLQSKSNVNWDLGLLSKQQQSLQIDLVNRSSQTLDSKLFSQLLSDSQPWVLKPGGRRSLKLWLGNFSGYQRYSRRIQIASLTIELRGQCVDENWGLLRVWPNRLDIGELAALQKHPFQFRLFNELKQSVELVRLSSVSMRADDHWNLDLEAPQTLKPGASLKLSGQYTAGRQLGGVMAKALFQFREQPQLQKPLSAWVQAPEASETLHLFYESDMHGEIEPCGCGGVEHLGGLAKLSSAVRSQPKSSRLFLSAGNIAGGNTGVYRRRQKLAYKALKTMGLETFVPGPSDLEAGLQHFQDCLKNAQLQAVCANWSKYSPRILPFKQIQRGALNIAVTGFIDPNFIVQQTVQRELALGPVATRLSTVVASFDKDTNLRILLAQCELEKAVELARRFKFDLLICGSTSLRLEKPQMTDSLVTLACPDRGRRVGHLQLQWQDQSLGAFRHQLLDLGSQWLPDPAIQSQILTYRKALKSLPPFIVQPGPHDKAYAGWQSCQKCHADIVSQWQQTRHSSAILSLQQNWNHFDPACTQCHSLGQNRPFGFQRLDLTPELAHIQCESCHGPAAAHVKSPQTKLAPASLFDCRQCHNGKHSPAFEPKSYWRKIAHGQKSELEFWDSDKNGVLGMMEKSKLLAWRKQLADHETRRRQALQAKVQKLQTKPAQESSQH